MPLSGNRATRIQKCLDKVAFAMFYQGMYRPVIPDVSRSEEGGGGVGGLQLLTVRHM